MIAFLTAVVQASMPLLFATTGEIVTEKSGNLNLGVEGLMLIGAVFGFSVGYHTNMPVLALLAAMFAAGCAAALYALVTVTLRANQVVTGLALTLLGTGISGFLGKYLMGNVLSDTFKVFFAPLALPMISRIPLIGPVFFNQNIFVYFGYFIALSVSVYLSKTRFGLNVRVVGENPAAADASGISVSRYKYAHIIAGGALCGLGGAYLSLVYVPVWQENITAGRGWIAIALVIFSMWDTKKALFGALLFGGLDIVGFWLPQMGLEVSQYLLDVMPYLVTILVLIFVSMNKNAISHEPEHLGVSYFREDRH